tara:strand:- start:246 stop:797 length:552 start_codon:yes stop_codon:yes gene_type:complete
MALTDKKYERIFSETGSDGDLISADEKALMKKEFDDNTYIDDKDALLRLGPVLYQLQLITEELDYLRAEIETNKGKTGITSSQASAITANTAKTGITSQQSSNITDNTNEIKKLDTSVTNNSNTITSLNANKLEVTPDLNSSNKQRLVCGVVQNRGTYILSFTFSDVDKTGNLITKTGSIQLK